jgi:hypothetical protein
MWPPQRGVGSLEPNLGKQIVWFFVLILYCDLILLILSLSSLACNLFEFAPKVICINWSTHCKKNSLPHSDFILLILTLTPSKVCVQSL